MTGLSRKTLLLAGLLCASSLAKDWQEGVVDEDLHKPHKCTHDEQDFQEIGTLEVDEEDLNTDHTGRALASYPDFRAYGYYGFMGNAPSSYKNYVQNDLFPPIIDFFKKALKSKNPISGKLKINQSSICGYSTPSVLRNGVDADWVLIPKAEDSSSLGYVASTSTCFKASGTNRPLVGHIKVNRHYMKETSDVLTHEKNMMCVMHEVVHALGFSKSLYKYWKGAKISTTTLDGASATVVSAEPLTSKLRKHFGCSTLKGAYMENSGGSGTGGSHFERRQFANEVMTSGLIHDMQFSELTLALLESTGWYAADYSMADPYNWGRGQGCNFLTQKCSSSSFNYPEYMCKSSSRGCTASGTSGGSCSTDSRSDGCKWIHPSVSYHCENSNADSYARLPSIQAFGRSAGSKCFTGTLSTSSGASQTSFCFKYTCSGSGSSSKLTLNLGSKSVTCSKKGNVSVSGYKGTISCPDPVEYCATVGKKVCARGCMGRGTCNNGVCQCNKGFKGKDCALKA